MSNSGSLEKMIVAAYTDSSFKVRSGEMSVYINPEQYTRKYEILYNDTQAQGSSAGSPEYNKTPADVVTFQLVFDGTGVVPSTLPGTPPFSEDGIVTQIETFMGLAFKYDGDIHSPNFIQLSWGTLLFNCRLSSLSLNYILFKPDGTPLRARADTTFVEFRSQQDIAQTEDKKSPDMSHLVIVKSSDTLPNLCQSIYGDCTFYAKVAAFNGLTDFRDLTAGMKLLFPPLGDATP